MKVSEELRNAAARIAREAFDCALRAASQPRAERERQKMQVQGFAQDVLGNACEAEVQRRVVEQGAA